MQSIKGLALSAVLGMLLTTQVSAATLDVGDQRGNARAVMEAAGVLKDVPYAISWHEFANAAPLLEALNANHLDAGSVGDAPLTFAAAAGVQAKAIFASKYLGNAVIVRQDSPIKSAADLKGKKIATVKGSSGYALLMQSLKQAGVGADQVQLVFTTPAEATLVLDQGGVDAVASWEPYISFAIDKSQVRIVADGSEHLSLNYLIASPQAIAQKRTELVDFRSRLATARQWALAHNEAYAKVISELLKIPEPVALNKVKRESNLPLNDFAVIRQTQQGTIDLYHDVGLIPNTFSADTLIDTSFAAPVAVASSAQAKP